MSKTCGVCGSKLHCIICEEYGIIIIEPNPLFATLVDWMGLEEAVRVWAQLRPENFPKRTRTNQLRPGFHRAIRDREK